MLKMSSQIDVHLIYINLAIFEIQFVVDLESQRLTIYFIILGGLPIIERTSQSAEFPSEYMMILLPCSFLSYMSIADTLVSHVIVALVDSCIVPSVVVEVFTRSVKKAFNSF